ncbi:hydrolase [Streptomyces agglomeratus]|uniref:Hydrolase n=1 Tax=Streptomyces agglomeratus TaxID=285458 RepID=A0A1E5P9M9_9ACTN|nr:alpha/beta hydrolase [Streptomyces agglomeratus]OEJ26242.1 hydrolase [Streptomyces agglomeratus]OEJ39700.1 hydrolase [Streptomyces agglomeratus]OEJ45917.1 hydrolase [Streptomyces agglomeratus]OEJ52262.1 hydrolase [Streptomyces agglomeratus]OEJ59619.1 hydrolase [Streptomyces agglomeratus]
MVRAAREPGRGPVRRTVLRAQDGVRIEALYEPAPGGGGGPAIVVAHGFTGSVDRPAVRRAARVFRRYGAVVTFSFRGHGGSGGRSTVGDREVLDVAAAVRWARSLGHERVVTVGFSMGGSVVVRHAALHREDTAHSGADGDAGDGERTEARPAEGAHASADRDPVRAGNDSVRAQSDPVRAADRVSARADAVVAVSAPARWYYRGTAPMRRLHWVVTRPAGRLVGRFGLRTRIHSRDWDPVPLSPVEAAARLGRTPLLVVHGDRDPYFPLDHPRALAAAAEGSELWIVPGMGHAENAAEETLLTRIGAWLTAA